ncbi:MAG: hypothetical protein WAU00_03625 [Caldilinea sp.]|uniref:hypothetical protein n=1 Tax=Caldilinea sp. TaxID=2293560 RepID=UPI002B720148|nr:hypothetical protein [Anaerolineales bacterium]HQY93791.1 hypothetical protein [Caldilinea sp.]HRA64724.1 hypothetical protein [Caldilinea sp.]
MRIDVKPLTHWVIYKGYRVRFTSRSAARVAGILTTQDGGEIDFIYDPATRMVQLPGAHICINEYGWELEHHCDKTSASQ